MSDFLVSNEEGAGVECHQAWQLFLNLILEADSDKLENNNLKHD